MINDQVHSIHTPCKQCVFAKYDNITQTGCHLDYIDKYRTSGIQILEAYDDHKEFYIINDKKCIGYRENKWFDQFDLANSPIEDKINHYKQNNKLHYLVIVNMKNFSADQLVDFFTELTRTDIRPQKIILIRYRDPSANLSYETIESIINDSKVGCSWRIQTMLDDSISYEEILHNTTTVNQKYRFIMSISEPTPNFAYLIDYTNDIVYEKLEQFGVVSNPSKTAIIYSGGVYRFGIAHNENILNQYDKYDTL
jgi:hypothetical protein